MDFREYERGTGTTWRTDQTIDPTKAELVNAIFGLAGEAGELTDLIKKDLFHGVPADSDKVLKELGDVLYYVTRVAHYYGFDLETVADTNYQKLAARYPKGFVEGGGIR